METRQQTLAKNIYALIDKKCADIDSYLKELNGSQNLTYVQQRADYESWVAPQFKEVYDSLNALKQYNLENLTVIDLENIIACLTSDLHKDVQDAVTAFINDKSQTQASLWNFKEIVTQSYRVFYFEKDITPTSKWKNSFVEIVSKLAIKQSALNLDTQNISNSVKDYVDQFKREAGFNLLGLVIFIGFLACFLCFEYNLVLEDLIELSFGANLIPDNRFYLLLLKNAFAGVLSLGVFYALLKVCAVFIHNFLVNREKSLALSVFNSFFSSYDSVVRTEAAVVAIRTVLGTRDSGVFKVQQGNDLESLDKLKSFMDFTNK